MASDIIKKIGGALGFEDEENKRFGPLAPVKRTQLRIVVYSPKEFGDVRSMAESLLERAAVLICFENVDDDLCRRIIDYMNGVGYALDARVEKISNRLVIYAPENAAIEKEMPPPAKSFKWF
ncbi:MAG: cell division protein SepF [Acidaminococcales bacterium]|jgi:FtsZ-interacting cell division protein YlmF|nr:cell division protein SepF [Acidaminococcales bacterium]